MNRSEYLAMLVRNRPQMTEEDITLEMAMLLELPVPQVNELRAKIRLGGPYREEATKFVTKRLHKLEQRVR